MFDHFLAPEAGRLALGAGFVLLLLGVLVARRPRLVVGHPRLVLLGVALVSAVAALALVRLEPPGLRLQLDPSTEPLLPLGDPGRALYEQAVLEFGDDEIYAIAMESDDAFARESLETLSALHGQIAQLPGVRRVTSLADTVSFRYDAAEDWVEIGRLFNGVPESDAELAALRDRALADPLLRRTAVSKDGRTAGISIRFREMTDREFIASRLDEQIAALLDAAARPGLSFYVAGRPHAKARVYHGMVRDLTVLIPLAVAMLAIVLVIATGSRRGVALPIANVLIATLWTFGAMALLARPLTILSTLLGPMLIAIGSVYGVHMLARYDEERAEPGDAAEVAARTLLHVRLPVAIAGTTTQIGFGALMLSDVPAVIELGGFSVLGVACVSFLSLVALPAALALLPPRREVSALPAALARLSERFAVELERSLAGLAAACVRRSGRVIALALVASCVAALAIPRIVIDTDYLSFFDEDAPVRRDFAAMNRLLSGAIPIYVVLSGNGAGSFREPEAMRALEALQERVARIPGVSHTLSMADTLRVMNRAVERDDPAEARIPDTRPAVMELLQMAPKDAMHRFTNVNHSRANLVVRTGEVGSAAIRRLTYALRAAVRDVLPEGLEGAPAGNAILLARSADGIARSQGLAVGLAAGSIFVLISLLLGSVRLGLLAMVPNLLPVGVYFGLLGLGAAPLSLPTSLIGSMALGIAIDDTAHFLVRYRRERSAGRSPEEAARETAFRVGRPIAITSLMLSLGFLVITLSGFVTLREFGVLSATTMAVCLLTDLALLPALLARARA